MTESQRDLVKKLRSWVEDFVACKNKSFEPQDCFIGYHADAPATLVAEVFDRNKQNISLDDLFYEAKKLLIQCATPESIIRLAQGPLANEADDIFRLYSTEQYHSGLLSLLQTLGVRHSMQKKFFEVLTLSVLSDNFPLGLSSYSSSDHYSFKAHVCQRFQLAETVSHAFQWLSFTSTGRVRD